MNYLESKVKYNKVTEQGRVKRAAETYLVDAMSYTEAEAKTLQHQKIQHRRSFETAPTH